MITIFPAFTNLTFYKSILVIAENKIKKGKYKIQKNIKSIILKANGHVTPVGRTELPQLCTDTFEAREYSDI